MCVRLLIEQSVHLQADKGQPIKPRWLEPENSSPSRQLLWDTSNHPLDTDPTGFFQNTQSPRLSLHRPSACLYLQDLNFNALSGLSMYFSPGGRLTAIRKYTDLGECKTIGSFNHYSAVVHFALKCTREYITDVWIRHYDIDLPNMIDLAVLVSG